MNLQKILRDASDFLKRNRIKSPKLDSELLMSKILKSNRFNFDNERRTRFWRTKVYARGA